MKLILQAINSLFRRLENSIPKTAEDVGALPDTTTALPNPKRLIIQKGGGGLSTRTFIYDGTEDVTYTEPTAMKNPCELTFTGAVSASYNGISPVSVEIPSPNGDVAPLLNVINAIHYAGDYGEDIFNLYETLGLTASRNGIFRTGGTFYYYANGSTRAAGLIRIKNDLYYAKGGGEVVNNKKYWVGTTNNMLPETSYYFLADGKMRDPTVTCTNNLTNVTTSYPYTCFRYKLFQNDAFIVNPFTATLTAVEGYTISDVTVTMGGEDVTATAYADGSINIAEVTGDIVITATAI